MAAVVASVALRAGVRVITRNRYGGRARFWSEQVISLAALVTVIVFAALFWLPDRISLGGALGLITAGVAVALQRVITSFAAYLIILRGELFTVGDRIKIGGVRGDVVALRFMQTTVLEMGQSPREQPDEPAIYRDILSGFKEANLSYASSSSEISIVSPLRVESAAV